MLSTAMAAMVNFLMRTLLWKDVMRMSAAQLTRNLQLGQGAGSFEDVTLLNLYSVAIGNHSQQKGLPRPARKPSFIIRSNQFVVLFASFWNSSINGCPIRLFAALFAGSPRVV